MKKDKFAVGGGGIQRKYSDIYSWSVAIYIPNLNLATRQVLTMVLANQNKRKTLAAYQLYHTNPKINMKNILG